MCKAGVTVDSLVPIYSGSTNSDPRKREDIPKRPQAERMNPIHNEGQNGSFSFGFGVFPGFFMNWVEPPLTRQNTLGRNGEQANPASFKQLIVYFIVIILLMFFFSRSDHIIII